MNLQINWLNSIILVNLILLIHESSQVNLQFNEQLYVPTYEYVEFVKNQVKIIVEERFNPGEIEALLTLQSMNNLYFDVFKFQSCSDINYICFIQALQNQQYSLCEQYFQPICQNCSVNCLESLNLNNQSNSCCLGCNSTVMLSILQAPPNSKTLALQVENVVNEAQLYIVNNSPFPGNISGQMFYSNDLSKQMLFNTNYTIQFTPNNSYYVWTLTLIIVLAIVLLLLSSCLCILIYKYKKAKSLKLQFNLVSGEDATQELSNQNANFNRHKTQKSIKQI